MRPFGLQARRKKPGRLWASPLFYVRFETACIFVDGENLRHSLIDLFTSELDPRHYLPRNADWAGFFDDLVRRANADSRLRTYWYVVDHIDFWPWGLWRELRTHNLSTLEILLRKHKPTARELDAITDTAQKAQYIEQLAKNLVEQEKRMKNRFDGWKVFQDGIALRFDSVEFRRAGSIGYNLFRNRLGKEKAVDVNLATDLLELREIYDVGIIVSGDQDYVPAVQVVKDSGKHIVNVSFRMKDGRLLPGGARRLNRATDRRIEMQYADIRKFMRFPTAASTTRT